MLSILQNSKSLMYVLIGLVVVVIFFAVILIVGGLGDTTGDATIQVWGVFDDQMAFDRAITDFQKLNPKIKVEYTAKTFEDYEASAINAFASGRGPDVWMIHNTWLAKHGDKLAALPEDIPGLDDPLMTVNNFKKEFVDVAFDDLVFDDRIYGMPLYVDTLALYYNKDLLNSAGITRPATTWEQFNQDIEKLVKFDADGNVTQAAAALGTARNINRSTDILMSLMIQSGVEMTDNNNNVATFSRSVDGKNVGQIALQYYTDFANPSKRTYTWNNNQHYSIDAFIEGNTAMMFNYAHQVGILKEKASRLNFGVAPMPQLEVNDARTFASYWALAVSNSSANPNQAWQFVAHMASKPGALAYLSHTNRPAARRDLIEVQQNEEDIGIFAKQALSARSWFQIDSIAIEKIFAEMIDDVLLRKKTIADALNNAESRVTVLLVNARREGAE